MYVSPVVDRRYDSHKGPAWSFSETRVLPVTVNAMVLLGRKSMVKQRTKMERREKSHHVHALRYKRCTLLHLAWRRSPIDEAKSH
jgi:hypothetical protein